MANFWEVAHAKDVQKISEEMQQSNKLTQVQHELTESQYGAHSYADAAADITAGVDDDPKPNKGASSLEDRAMSLAAKMSKSKQLDFDNLAKLLVMQIFIRLKDNPSIDKKKMDEIADDKFVEKSADSLRNSKAFVNLMDKPIPADYKFLKDGKAYEALALEQRKIMDEEKAELEKHSRIQKEKTKEEIELSKGTLGIDANSRVGQAMVSFNKLETPEQKKARIEQLFGVKDLSKMNSTELKKVGMIRDFIKDANELKANEIEFQKQQEQPESPQKKNENLQLGQRYL